MGLFCSVFCNHDGENKRISRRNQRLLLSFGGHFDLGLEFLAFVVPATKPSKSRLDGLRQILKRFGCERPPSSERPPSNG